MDSYARVSTTAVRLKEAMQEAEKKQADLVRETGLDRGAISSYVSGKYEPKQKAIGKLAVALGVSEMWLFGYNVPKQRTAEQKKNDQLAELIVKMRRNPDLAETMADLAELAELNPEKYVHVKGIIAALRQ